MWGKLFLSAALCAMSTSAWATNFAVLLSNGNGEPDVECSDVLEVQIDDLTFDAQEITTALNANDRRAQAAGWRLYGPGVAHWGSVHFTVPRGRSKELQAWFQEAAKGKNIRKNITVTLFKSDKTPGRTYNLFDTFPTQWSSVNFDTKVAADTETLTVKIGRIEFKTRVAGSGPSTGGVLVSTPNGQPLERFESWGGGEPLMHLTSLFNNTKFRTNSPGHKSVGEITLRSAALEDRPNLYAWLNDALGRKGWKKSLTITELLSVDGGVKDGKQYIYSDCFPTRYVFPRMSVTNTTGNTMEEVTVKPIRVELK